MRKAEIKIGSTYQVKVSGKLSRVRINGICPFGGWYGTNTSTGRDVRIRTAARLRFEIQKMPTEVSPMTQLSAEAAAKVQAEETAFEGPLATEVKQ
jgi:hypothetical protein